MLTFIFIALFIILLLRYNNKIASHQSINQMFCMVFFALIITYAGGCSLSDTQNKLQLTPKLDTSINKGQKLYDLSNFKAISECFIDTEPSKTHGTYFQFSIDYDLNMDGIIDKVNFVTASVAKQPSQSIIQVNMQELMHTIDPSSVDIDSKMLHIIDLDQRDNYHELAIFEQGPGGVLYYQLYRYDGTQLYYIGKLPTDSLINQEGKIISSDYLTKFLTPSFCSAWYEIKKNSLVLFENDTDYYLNRFYDFTSISTYFMPCDQLPASLKQVDGEYTEFEPGKLKLIDLLYVPDSRVLNYYFVELPSGRRGLLYFYIV